MAITRMLPNAVHFKEFYGGYHGTCGQTALATALVCATPKIESHDDAVALMLSLTKEMIGLGWADASGATTMGRLAQECVRRGFSYDSTSFVSYQEPLPADALHQLLLDRAGLEPICLEIARAGAGLHAVDGSHAEAGVNYHFICVVGITPDGYVCNDGDNNTIEQHLVTYSWDALQTARPCAVMVVHMQQGDNTVAVPMGWKDDGKVLTAPNGRTVQAGFAGWVRSHAWDADDLPLTGEVQVSASPVRNVQTFVKSGLVWDAAGGVRRLDVGAQLLAAQAKLAGLVAVDPAKISPVLDDLKALEAALAALQAAPKPAADPSSPADPAQPSPVPSK